MSKRSIKMTAATGLGSAVLGAVGGIDLDLMGAARPFWIGTLGGAAVGLLVGLIIGSMQARYEAASSATTPTYAWRMAFGACCIMLSIASFAASQFVPGVRPLLLARAPVRPDGPNTTRLTVKADADGPLAIVLALQDDPAVKALKGMDVGNRSKAPGLPPASTVRISCNPPGAYSEKSTAAFDSSGAKHVELGTLSAAAGKTYILTAAVTTSFPSASYWDPHIEAHRTMESWSRAFPKMLLAAAMGLLLGVIGVTLSAWGGVQQWNAKQAGKQVGIG